VSAAENKQLVEGCLNAFSRGDLDAVEEALAPDFVNHDAPEVPGVGGDRAGVLAAIGYLKTAFPDARADLVSVVAEGDKVGVHDQLVGTHESGVPRRGADGTRGARGLRPRLSRCGRPDRRALGRLRQRHPPEATRRRQAVTEGDSTAEFLGRDV